MAVGKQFRKQACPWCGVDLWGRSLRRRRTKGEGAVRLRGGAEKWVCPECGEGVRWVEMRASVFWGWILPLGVFVVLMLSTLWFRERSVLPVPLLLLIVVGVGFFWWNRQRPLPALGRAPRGPGVEWALPYLPKRDVCPWCGVGVKLGDLVPEDARVGAQGPGGLGWFLGRFWFFYGEQMLPWRWKKVWCCPECQGRVVVRPGGEGSWLLEGTQAGLMLFLTFLAAWLPLGLERWGVSILSWSGFGIFAGVYLLVAGLVLWALDGVLRRVAVLMREG